METQFLRLSLELEVVRGVATKAGRDAAAQAERIVQLQEIALSIDGDMERFGQLDRQFHQSMLRRQEFPICGFFPGRSLKSKNSTRSRPVFRRFQAQSSSIASESYLCGGVHCQ
ncbi:FCD domain-containing protein (plasmid) [Peteryoungia desertarenae]|uniref:FCD domain-containing protein n=1 Tax=Peteryoungia desertarenae TaxID=1813451 RepID=A0ABX6QUR3_9HYPH|nr:FCD domain-containing protein [Peteryoungia desertarenae]